MFNSIKMKFRYITVFIGFTLTFVLFQNCSETKSINPGSDSGKIIARGNGDGYGGKATYVNYDVNNECSDDSSDIKSIIEIIDDKPYMTKDNCQEISPKLVEGARQREHNLDFVHFSGSLFEVHLNNAYSEVLCHADGLNPMNGYHEKGDAFVRKEGEKYYAYIKIGLYENDELIEARNAEKLEVKPLTLPDGSVSYSSLKLDQISAGPDKQMTSTQGEFFMLHVSADGSTATLAAMPTIPGTEEPIHWDQLACKSHED